MLKPTCLCCSDNLLRHIRSGEVYWFCCHCNQEMPVNANVVPSPTHRISPNSRVPKASTLGISKEVAQGGVSKQGRVQENPARKNLPGVLATDREGLVAISHSQEFHLCPLRWYSNPHLKGILYSCQYRDQKGHKKSC